MRNPRRQRGMALITAVVVTLVVAVISVGVIRFASLEVAGAAAGARREALVACAEAGRQLLVSQFRRLGQTLSVDALDLPLDAAAPPNRTRVVGGHVYQAANIQVSQITTLPATSVGPSRNVSDESNRLPSSFGGKPTRVIVHCIDGGDGTATGGRQLEVEFTANMGI